ncbi:biopolymer transporter ExbD [Acidobacteria bacterium AH-259-L09]|nr:biopolymer transporter ExbD [Acidobacteria bacterium AH-259-L09]
MAVNREGRAIVSGVTADINVTPMADVMLVLLIIFMITTPLLQEGVFVNKPSARNAQEAPEAEVEDATMVTVTRNQEVWINRALVPDEQVAEILADRIALAPELPLFIKGDVATRYGKIVEIVNNARDAGAERIGLMVDRQREEGR